MIALASAINELTKTTCKLRTAVWCSLQLMLNLNESLANMNQKIHSSSNDLFFKLNDDFNHVAPQIKELQLNDDRLSSLCDNYNNGIDHTQNINFGIHANTSEKRYNNSNESLI